ncbi:peptidoglycan/xylan/chitin deacetylase (PgdA/CDA1 family) [Paenibacillus phyllosphaerae]|uniref:Peptidoglycan/xylan/chitin deacetylase (PgdA/CDA1 family) n=1 Tax=Paenibacillus phyllosphaerae TaxID=274593 RepID=A0A7W5B1D1_9BACL|nr:polysaccharide deacetylase family protein [Paenibacillus phyllosphaerae]MBB3111906.1 peptidoglycan/xylan/chitin deacetylase (PgdA/CDA1 family) [Paenibacillus phyllosphaerae]
MSAEVVHQVETPHRRIAFTFDDGPNPVYTPQVLEIFREVSGQATFYMIGEQMEKHPDIVKAAFAEGHEIGNHTYTHPPMTERSTSEQRLEIERTNALIEQLTGRAPATFRPPYFNTDSTLEQLVASYGHRSIGALNGDARDWEQPGASHIVEVSRLHAKNGSILIFHDGYGDRSQTIEAVRTLAHELTAAGYQLVTVSKLLEDALSTAE